MIKAVATCKEQKGCPLYKVGDRLDFIPPEVEGVADVPVCAIAAGKLFKTAKLIADGAPPDDYAKSSCGGCQGNEAWWDFIVMREEKRVAVPPEVLKTLSKMRIFTGVSHEKLSKIVRLMKDYRAPAGKVLIARGSKGEAFYIILAGAVEVVQTDDSQTQSVVATLGPGECFGEMALITGDPASALVRAAKESTLLVVSRSDFTGMLAIAPEIGVTLARILANRLARTGRWIADELKKGISGRLDLISPAELVQAMNVNSQTGMLIVKNGDHDLKIYMHDGQVHEAELGGKVGEEAFFEFLTWANGHFRFEPIRKDKPVRQVKGDTVGLLLEGMRRVDEYRETGTWRKPQE